MFDALAATTATTTPAVSTEETEVSESSSPASIPTPGAEAVPTPALPTAVTTMETLETKVPTKSTSQNQDNASDTSIEMDNEPFSEDVTEVYSSANNDKSLPSSNLDVALTHYSADGSADRDHENKNDVAAPSNSNSNSRKRPADTDVVVETARIVNAAKTLQSLLTEAQDSVLSARERKYYGDSLNRLVDRVVRGGSSKKRARETHSSTPSSSSSGSTHLKIFEGADVNHGKSTNGTANGNSSSPVLVPVDIPVGNDKLSEASYREWLQAIPDKEFQSLHGCYISVFGKRFKPTPGGSSNWGKGVFSEPWLETLKQVAADKGATIEGVLPHYRDKRGCKFAVEPDIAFPKRVYVGPATGKEKVSIFYQPPAQP